MQVVVGAGVAGLVIANRLLNAGYDVVVLEKSRGFGGRLATRRIGNLRFDHGAQFLKANEPREIPFATDQWIRWADKSGAQYWASPQGMTNFAKNLAVNLDVRLEHLVTKIEILRTGYRLLADCHSPSEAERVYLSCPLPQSLKLLKNSHIAYDPCLDQIKYAKALIGLVGFEDAVPAIKLDAIQLNPTPDIAMVTDQKSKQVSNEPAWTFTMASNWSEIYFDSSEQEQKFAMLRAIDRWLSVINKDVQFNGQILQIKKWRYSHPLTQAQYLYSEVFKNLILIGDAFGGGSIHGSIRSAISAPL